MNQIYALLVFLITLTSGLIADVTHEDTEETDTVQNVIDNMVSGDVTPTEAHDYLFDLKYWAKQNSTDANGTEMEVNRAYIAYLNSALDVVNAYGNYGENSEEFKELYEIMQENKTLI